MAKRKLHIDFEKPCTKDELAALLDDIQDHLDLTRAEYREGLAATTLALCACKGEQFNFDRYGTIVQPDDAARNDREAELVRAGYRLGVCLSLYEEQAAWKFTKRLNRDKSNETKAEKYRLMYHALIADYQRLLPKHGCLGARHELESSYNLTLTRINQILKKYSIVINQKS